MMLAGPIFPVQPYSTIEEAIERANATNCGLGACVWGKDVQEAQRVGQQIEAGTVWINSWAKPDPRGKPVLLLLSSLSSNMMSRLFWRVQGVWYWW